MIKANELRIGNWLSFGGINQRVGAIDLDLDDESEELVSSIENYTLVRLRDGTVSPIPITHEILEKAGFTPRKPYNVYHNDKLGGIYFGFRGERIEGKPAHCKYVHQLQNIYFSLTGEELEVKL